MPVDYTKVALIIGGGSGIGFAVASMLAGQGWDIAIVDLNRESGSLAASNIGATFTEADVRNYHAISSAFDQTIRIHKRIDFVFANAGVIEPHDFYAAHETTPPPEPDTDTLDVNLKGAAYSSYLAKHYFDLTRTTTKDPAYDPCLVLTCSLAGLTTAPFAPLYTSSKHGIRALTHSIAPLYKERYGIRVSCVCPTLVDTTLTKTFVPTVSPDRIVPVESVSNAVGQLIAPDGGFGRCLKISPKGTEEVEALPVLTL